MQAAPGFEQSNVPRIGLSTDEQRIAQAVVNALSPTLQTIDITSIKKRLDVLEQEMRGVNMYLRQTTLSSLIGIKQYQS